MRSIPFGNFFSDVFVCILHGILLFDAVFTLFFRLALLVLLLCLFPAVLGRSFYLSPIFIFALSHVRCLERRSFVKVEKQRKEKFQESARELHGKKILTGVLSHPVATRSDLPRPVDVVVTCRRRCRRLLPLLHIDYCHTHRFHGTVGMEPPRFT